MQLRVSTCVLLALTAGAGWAQTQIDLRTQGRNVDFSAAGSTKPVRISTGLPSTCTVGDLYFRSDAGAGQNLYGCTSVNTWSVMGDGGGGGATGLLEFQISNTTTAASLSCPAGGCLYRVGEKIFQYPSGASATALTGSGGSALVFFYINASGVRAFGHDGATVTAATLSNLVAETGMTAFPPDSFPLALCSVSSNQFQSCTDLRAAYSRNITDAGPGILIAQDPSTGKTTVAVNPSYVPTLGGANVFSGANAFTQLATGVVIVPYSAAPVFDSSLGGNHAITLSGNVTSPTITNFVVGEMLIFKICQDGTGGRTFAWPGNVHGAMAVGSTANSCSVQMFLSHDGVTLYAAAPGVTDIL